jgi:DNA-binding MarR family transcriptional regulator
MTPARFDLLCILRRAVMNAPGWKRLDAARSQADLCKDLGLHRSTVSKMLLRLEEMGWIRRDRDSADRRTFAVGLTETGLHMIGVAMHKTFAEKNLRMEYEKLFREAPPPPPHREIPCWLSKEVDMRGIRPSAAEVERAKPPPPPRDIYDVINDVYSTVRRISLYFGDCSTVWYHIGKGLPDHA